MSEVQRKWSRLGPGRKTGGKKSPGLLFQKGLRAKVLIEIDLQRIQHRSLSATHPDRALGGGMVA